MNATTDHTTAIGTIAGTLLTVADRVTHLASQDHISWSDVYKTSLLAAIGAVVSFLVTLGLKWLTKHIRKCI